MEQKIFFFRLLLKKKKIIKNKNIFAPLLILRSIMLNNNELNTFLHRQSFNLHLHYSHFHLYQVFIINLKTNIF